MARTSIKLAGLVFITVTTTVPPVSAGTYPIAGLQPDRRPAPAPVISQVTKDTQWYRQALNGVIPPYPASLRFLESQGNWYTPFIHPGMTGPYDIRGWHQKK